ncbi:MAG: choice-of-anchor J domain-containing protein, partial [Ignavibacteria bacterium]|nr:choice-of-anchor J domain-containing protein [Ignavibacteria bacterium]
MTKRMKLIVSFAVILMLGFGIYIPKDPAPQKIDATSNSIGIEMLGYQAPSAHDRAGLVPPLWSESFDNTTFPPTGWLNFQESGTGLWTRVTVSTYPSGFNPHSGAGMTCFNSYNYSTGVTASLISSVFSLTSGQAKLGFWMLRDDGYNTSADKVDFMINTTASSTGATLLGTINRAKGLAPVETGANGWYYYEFTIPAGFNT